MISRCMRETKRTPCSFWTVWRMPLQDTLEDTKPETRSVFQGCHPRCPPWVYSKVPSRGSSKVPSMGALQWVYRVSTGVSSREDTLPILFTYQKLYYYWNFKTGYKRCYFWAILVYITVFLRNTVCHPFCFWLGMQMLWGSERRPTFGLSLQIYLFMCAPLRYCPFIAFILII
jgi:hypothetical protein